jgi:PAS domain S-box-containing protein
VGSRVMPTDSRDSAGAPNRRRPNVPDALHLSEERFRLMVESVTDYAIFMLDPDGRVATWNAGAERIKGYRADEIIGRHFSVFYPAESIARGWPDRELSIAAVDGRFEDEGPRLRKDGTTFWANVVISAVRGADGELRGFAKVTRDLTERRGGEDRLRQAYANIERRVEQRTEELAAANEALTVEVAERRRLADELRVSVVQLRQADEQKNHFLATLAHELRNPLSPLRSGIDLLKAGNAVDPRFSGTLDVLQRQVTHLSRLVDDLLDLSRISRNTLELRREPVDLMAAIRHAVEATQPAFEAGRHTITITPPDGPAVVRGDDVRLSQVFVNLLTNAARYTPEPGRIRIDVDQTATEVTARIADPGMGIASEDLERVFEMFTQTERTRFAGSGLGIGLNLARRIVELHGGTITAASGGPGHGSVFTVTLPRATGSPEVAKAEPESAVVPKRRILVVDDHADGRESLSMLLSILGHVVETAVDGRDALRVAETFQPEFVLLDIGMPEIDGYQTAQLIRQEAWGSMVLVALTGWGQHEDKQRAQRAGFDFHMTKPFDPAELERLLADR